MNKIEDYGMKAAEFIGKGKQVVLVAVFVGQDNARHREIGGRLRPVGLTAETADDF